MSKPVLCRLVKIDFQTLRNLMIRNRIYSDVGGYQRCQPYSYRDAQYLHSCITKSRKRKVFIRTDGIY